MRVHHDDAKHEYEYGTTSHIGTFSDSLMDEANKNGWTILRVKAVLKNILPTGD